MREKKSPPDSHPPCRSKVFLGKSTFCSMVEDHIENDFNASTMKLSSAPSCSCNIWVWLQWSTHGNTNIIKHDQTYVSLVFECTYVTNFYYPKVGVHDSEAVQQRSKTLQRSKASESFWSKTISNTAQLQNLFSLFSISGAALKHFWSLTKRRTMVLKPTIAAPIRSPQDETGWFKQTF